MHFMQSKKRKRRKKKSNKEFCAQHFKDWATIGRIIKVNGKELRVYTTAKLVEAFSAYGIPRTYQTINLWRKNGILPESPIIINRKSYYTRAMIEAIVLTFIECGADKKSSWNDVLKGRLQLAIKEALERELLDE